MGGDVPLVGVAVVAAVVVVVVIELMEDWISMCGEFAEIVFPFLSGAQMETSD